MLAGGSARVAAGWGSSAIRQAPRGATSHPAAVGGAAQASPPEAFAALVGVYAAWVTAWGVSVQASWAAATWQRGQRVAAAGPRWRRSSGRTGYSRRQSAQVCLVISFP